MKILKLGSTGPMVEFLQNILQILGFYQGRLDGIFGTQTRNAVLQFQKSYELSADGIVGNKTWNTLSPYINGSLGFIVPTNINYSSSILNININSLKELYPFISVGTAGKSVLNNDIPYIKVGTGNKEVFYSASIHANEWITSVVLMKFLADYCYCYENNLTIFNYPAKDLYENCSLYIMPMVNPDGVDLVTGEITPSSTAYMSAQKIALKYPAVPFTNGWKANIRGVDFKNFQSFCIPCKHSVYKEFVFYINLSKFLLLNKILLISITLSFTV